MTEKQIIDHYNAGFSLDFICGCVYNPPETTQKQASAIVMMAIYEHLCKEKGRHVRQDVSGNCENNIN